MKGAPNDQKWMVIHSTLNDYELAFKLAKFLENYVIMLAYTRALNNIDPNKKVGFYTLKQLLSAAKQLGIYIGVLRGRHLFLFSTNIRIVTQVP